MHHNYHDNQWSTNTYYDYNHNDQEYEAPKITNNLADKITTIIIVYHKIIVVSMGIIMSHQGGI